MARSTWEQKLNSRIKARVKMTPQERVVSDWLSALMERRGYKNFTQLSQHFFKCAMQCLPPGASSDSIESPSQSILGSWFRAESGVKDTWLDSIAYVRRVEEDLPASFSAGDVLEWIRNAPDPNIVTPDTDEEPSDLLRGSIVPTAEQIATWTEAETALVVSLAVAHWRRVSAPNAAANKKGKK